MSAAYYLPQKPRMGSAAYEEYLRLRRCGDKTQYSAEWVARNAATALGWVSERFAGLEPYPCPYCAHFHLGKPTFRDAPGEIPFGTIRALKQLREEHHD